jgi:DNA-binding PadR family transcriptional regulator
MQNILGPYGKMSKGRLYPLLMKLEEEGLIEVSPTSEEPESRPRSHIPSRSFRLTEAGRTRFHALMMDTTSYLGEYQRVFLQKVAYFSFLQPQERLHLIEHYLGYCQSLVSYGTTRAEELATGGSDPHNPFHITSVQLTDLLLGMRHRIQQWQQELLWAQELRDLIKADM